MRLYWRPKIKCTFRAPVAEKKEKKGREEKRRVPGMRLRSASECQQEGRKEKKESGHEGWEGGMVDGNAILGKLPVSFIPLSSFPFLSSSCYAMMHFWVCDVR